MKGSAWNGLKYSGHRFPSEFLTASKPKLHSVIYRLNVGIPIALEFTLGMSSSCCLCTFFRRLVSELLPKANAASGGIMALVFR